MEEENKPWNVSDDGKYYIESLQVDRFVRGNGEVIRVSWPIDHYTDDGKYAYTENGSIYSVSKGEQSE